MHAVVGEDGYSAASKPPPDAWLFSGELDPTKPLCFDTLLRLHRETVRHLPHDKWVNSARTVLGDHATSPPWSKLMPRGEHRTFVKNLVNSLAEIIDRLPKDYYTTTWGPCGRLLSGLKAAKVDGPTWRSISESVEKDSGALDTFRPGPGGFLQPVVYDRFATRTGRLTVASGPNILTLKRDYRRVLRSTFAGGAVCSLDFSALEARIILAEAGRSSDSVDLYADIAREAFGGRVPRDAVKTAVISELYGASKSALGARLGIGGKALDDFSSTIRSYFGVADLHRRLRDEFIRTGKIRNRYGRSLELDDPQDRLFVNTYAQSTGVDVSLLGFKAVMDRLGEDGVRPLFVLHDALILDVKDERLVDVGAVTSVAVPGYPTEFPLKLEKI